MPANGCVEYGFVPTLAKPYSLTHRKFGTSSVICVNVSDTQANNMTTVSYLMSVTSSQKGAEVFLAILNIAGRGHAFHGSSNGAVSKDLWIIPKGNKNKQEVIKQLQAIPAILSVSVVALSKPVRETELAEVRELFAGFGWDASSVTDDELSLFINAKLQGQYTYFIDYDFEKARTESVKIHVKPIEEHPHFSPDWLKKSIHVKEEMADRELTIDDIKISSVEIEEIEEEIETPPPPASDQQQMTDE